MRSTITPLATAPLAALLLFLCAGILNAQTPLPITGTVTDAESGEAIGGAVVRSAERTRTYTTLSGRFRLPLAPGRHAITISSIGYADTTITAEAGASDLTIRLRPSAISSRGVEIGAGLSAREIVEHAIAAKDVNLAKAKTVQGLLYTKTSFDVEGNAFGQIEDADRHGIIETFSRAYYSDKGPRIKVIQRRQTANIPASSNLLAIGNFVSFYDNELQVINTTIPSPLNPNTLGRYTFTLRERASLNGQTIFVVDVKPATTVLPTFEGTIKIAAGTFDLVEADLSPSKSTAVAFVRGFRLQQKFEKVKDDIWFPTYLNATGSAEVELVKGIATIRGNVAATSIFTELAVNEPIPDSVYADERIIAAAPDADSSRSEFWEGNTLSELTPEERQTYQTIDSLVDAADTVSTRHGVTLNVSPHVEFNRAASATLGLAAGPSFGPMQLDLLGAYSFGQRRAVGSAELELLLFQGDTLRFLRPSPDGDFGLSVRGSLFSLIAPTMGSRDYPTIVTTAAAALFHRDYADYLRKDGWGAGLDIRFEPLRASFDLEGSRQFALGNSTSRSIFIHKAFRENPRIREGSYRTAAVELGMGREENEVAISSSRSASFGLTLTGLYGEMRDSIVNAGAAGPATPFRLAEGRLRFSFPTIPTGYAPMELELGLRGGIGSDLVPTQYQFRMPTSVAFVGRSTSFYSAPTGLYGGTRYAAIFAEHDFTDILWRAIGLPTIEGRGVDLSISGAAGWFDRPGATDSAPLAPAYAYIPTGGKWYAEAGFGIGRIPTFISNVFLLKFNARWGIGELGKGKFGAVLELSSPF